MGQLIIAVFLGEFLFTVVLVAVHFQKKESKRFDEEIKEWLDKGSTEPRI